MITDRFNSLLEARLTRIRQVLGSKVAEYAKDSDRLHNFKKAARRLNCTPEEALRGMKEKHCVSVDDIIEDISKGVLPTRALLAEKIGDEINYLILLEALIIERIEKEGYYGGQADTSASV